ncbi:TetR family transcriptional regulator [Streptomyces sp. TLI_235]|nr:TetR/AcrR family transcriptional regulator [Streptomyces sp. TLI_235]PBC71073.1 TetR family transcriptional regulator [Streptomyces sp. TLI_235]
MGESAEFVVRRSHARSNRARILAVARQEFGANPEVTLDEIARAAGVVRRTLYGHFNGRAALLEALAEEASQALRDALTVATAPTRPAEGPERSLARLVVGIWQVGDRYRVLLSLALQDLGAERVDELLRPARHAVVAAVERGQDAGVFHRHLPAAVLGSALEALTLALLEAVNAGAWEDPAGTATATETLIALGVPTETAADVARDLSTVDGPAR